MKVLFEYLNYGSSDNIREYEEIIKSIKLVRVLNGKEFSNYCNDLARMDKAYDQELLEEMLPHLTLDPSEIKNKELQLFYLKNRIQEGKFISGYLLIRYMNYLITGSTLFINKAKEYNNNFYDIFSLEVGNEIHQILATYEKELARYWNTYHDTFIAIKIASNHSGIKNKINRIMMQARKYNNQVDLSIKYDLDIIFDIKNDIEKVKELLSNKSLKELLKMYNLLLNEDYYKKKRVKMYPIRNGKVFFKEYKKEDPTPFIPKKEIIKLYISKKLLELENTLKEKYNTNEVFNLPVEYTSPIVFSQKKASGGVYYKSSFPIKSGYKIGISWEFCGDTDLSGLNINTGQTISWNTSWGNSGVRYSGDCTSAGSEYLEFGEVDKDLNYLLKINLYSIYNYDSTPKFRVFIVDENDTEIYKSDDIAFDKKGYVIGYIKEGRFILNILNSNNRHVEYSKEELPIIVECFIANLPIITFEELLDDLGIKYNKVDKSTFEGEYLYNLI